MAKPLTGLHHVALKVKDFDRTVAFYEGVLGLETKHAWTNGDNRVVMMEIGNGNFLEVFEGGSEQPGEGHFIHLAFATADVVVTMERVREFGCTIHIEPRPVQAKASPPIFGKNAFFSGPNGETIEIFEPAS